MDSLASVLWTVVVIIVAVWLLGLRFQVAGYLNHILLIIAVLVAASSRFAGRRREVWCEYGGWGRAITSARPRYFDACLASRCPLRRGDRRQLVQLGVKLAPARV